jgi:hypothetical protein
MWLYYISRQFHFIVIKRNVNNYLYQTGTLFFTFTDGNVAPHGLYQLFVAGAGGI